MPGESKMEREKEFVPSYNKHMKRELLSYR